MSSYYKKINGKSYDRAMLDIAAESTAGKGDGRISLADAKSIIKQIKDGGKITDTEKRTLNYILEKYNLTEAAIKHIEKNLSEIIYPDFLSEPDKNGPAVSAKSYDMRSISEIDSNKPKTFKKIYIIFILLIIAAIAFFAYIKYFYKNSKTAGISSEKKDDIKPGLEKVNSAVKTDDSVKKIINEDNFKGKEEDTKIKDKDRSSKSEKIIDMPIKKISENEYRVKEGDSLIKISEAIYGDYKKWLIIYKLNKNRINDPKILYPGQVLELPEK